MACRLPPAALALPLSRRAGALALPTSRGAWALTLALLLGACAAEPIPKRPMRLPPEEPTGPSPEVEFAQERLAAAAIAPRPYSAEQIRAAMPVGFTTRHLVELTGQEANVSVMRVEAATAEGVTLSQWVETPAGELVGERRLSEETWVGLRDHATFVEAETTIHREPVTTPAGTFACTLYTVRSYADGRMVESRFWFADEKPGAPVRYTRTDRGEVTYRLTLTAYGREPAAGETG